MVWKYLNYGPGSYYIYGTRVTSDGEVLDPSGIPICTNSGSREYPSVSWDGTNFLVSWREVSSASIFGARVTPEGEVLDPGGIDLGEGADYNQKRPASASDGMNTLVVWEHQLDADNWDICGIRLDPEGNILGDRTILSLGSNSQTNGSIGWNGENFLIVWQDLRAGRWCDLYGIRMNSRGESVDPASFPICNHSERQESPQLAWDGENFLVVWQDRRDGDWDIFGTLVSPEGVVSDTDGFGIATATGQPGRWCEDTSPDLDWSGESFMVVWRQQWGSSEPDLFGRRVSATGTPVGSSFEISTERAYYGAPRIAWGESNYLAVYSWKWFTSSYGIYGQLIDIDGTLIGDKITIYQDDSSQTSPYVTWGAGNYLVVWKDDRNGDYDIYGARVSSQGDILDPEGIPIFVGEGGQVPFGLTYDGTNYVILWLVGYTTYCTRVTPDGVVLDPEGIKIFSSTFPLQGLYVSHGPSDLSFIVEAMLMTEPPYSSPRLCGAFFWGDSIPNYPPEPFSLILPADGDTVVRPTYFDWEDAQDPNPRDDVYYDLYISTSPSFDPDSTITVDSISVSEYVLGELEYGILYYWKVRAYDPWSSIWSDQVWSFDVENYGDASGDGVVDVADVIYLINYLFRNGDPPDPLASGDENGDCEVNIGDVIYLINYLFREGPPPRRGCA